MEKRELTEVAKLKLQNISLSIQILKMQAEKLMEDRERILKEEHDRLGCEIGEWGLDEQNGVLIREDKK